MDLDNSIYAWGENVMTTGYGSEWQPPVLDPNQFYRSDFGGTSGAAPMVAGAAAVMQGVSLAKNGIPLSPALMRLWLNVTGTPQGASPRLIGTMPDLNTAVTQLQNFKGFKFPKIPGSRPTSASAER